MQFWLELDKSCSIAQEQKRNFAFDTLFTIEYLNQFFKEIKHSGTKQIRIQLTNENAIPERVEKPFPSFPVCRVVMHFDILSFIDKDVAYKKKVLVRVLMTASFRAAEEMGWSKDAFLDVYDKIMATNCEFVKTINRKQKNGSKKQTAQVMCEIVPGAMVYKLSLTDAKIGTSREIPIGTFLADRVFDIPGFNKLIAAGRWLDDMTYEISNDSKEIFHRIDTTTSLCSVHFEPIDGTSLEYIRDKYEYAVTNDILTKEKIKKRWF